MRHEIDILKSQVYEEVAKQAEFSAGRHMLLSDGENSDSVADAVMLTEEDNVLLDDYWKEAAGQLILGLKRWLYNTPAKGEILHLEFCLTENWDTSTAPALEEAVRGYMVQIILSRWLLTAAGMGNTEIASAATAAADMATANMTAAITALTARVAPTRRYTKKDYYDRGLL